VRKGLRGLTDQNAILSSGMRQSIGFRPCVQLRFHAMSVVVFPSHTMCLLFQYSLFFVRVIFNQLSNCELI
jgi:hypothetical protein